MDSILLINKPERKNQEKNCAIAAYFLYEMNLGSVGLEIIFKYFCQISSKVKKFKQFIIFRRKKKIILSQLLKNSYSFEL